MTAEAAAWNSIHNHTHPETRGERYAIAPASTMATSLPTPTSSAFEGPKFLCPSSRGALPTSTSFSSLGTRLSARNFRICCEAGASFVAKPATLQKVVKIVAKQLATLEEKIKPDSKFSDLGADSLDQVEIVMALEEEFAIGMEESGAEAIVTVQDAANLIEEAAAVAPAGAPAM